MQDFDDELTPVEPVRVTSQAIRHADLCAQEVANRLGMRELPSSAKAAINEWMLNAMRGATESYRRDLERMNERLTEATAQLIVTRNALRRAP